MPILAIFKMAAVRHLEFQKFAVFVMWPSWHAVLLPGTIAQSVDELWSKKRFSRWRPLPS